MISAWQVYLVMQLDSFNTLLLNLFLISVALFFICLIAKIEGSDMCMNIFHKCWWIPLFFGMILTALPNSKTAAAIMILPAITSDKVIDAITPEAKELYGLAKDALKSLSKDECKSK